MTVLSVTLTNAEAAAVEAMRERMAVAIRGEDHRPSKAAALRSCLWQSGYEAGGRFLNAARQARFMEDLAVALGEIEPDADKRTECLLLISRAHRHADERERELLGITLTDIKPGAGQ